MTSFFQINRYIVFVLFVIGLLIAGAFYIPVPANLDFQVLYFSNLSFIHGIDIYNHTAQVEMIATLRGVRPDDVFILPFPYPPWYVLSTFFLAWLPQEIAARIWFELNFLMLMLSTWLLTDGWNVRLRLVSFLVAILYIPVLGSLYVGQYNFPVLLGSALFIYALKKENVILTTLAFVLLTFKPHLGVPLAGIMFIHLIIHRTEFTKRVVKAILLTVALLFVISFIADSVWVVNYVKAIIGYQAIPSDVGCFICTSLPVTIYYFLTGQMALPPAFLIGGLLFVFTFIVLYVFRRDILSSPIKLFVSSILIIFLSAPYIFNYDYVLLLVPIFSLIASSLKWKWVWATLAYLSPQLLIALLGRGSNLFLPFTALLMLIIILFHPKISLGEASIEY